jgi:ankyrin repeat protein
MAYRVASPRRSSHDAPVSHSNGVSNGHSQSGPVNWSLPLGVRQHNGYKATDSRQVHDDEEVEEEEEEQEEEEDDRNEYGAASATHQLRDSFHERNNGTSIDLGDQTSRGSETPRQYSSSLLSGTGGHSLTDVPLLNSANSSARMATCIKLGIDGYLRHDYIASRIAYSDGDITLPRLSRLPSVVDKHGCALHIAAAFGDIEIAKRLLHRGMHLNGRIATPVGKGSVRGYAFTPLHYAVGAGQVDMVKLLLDRGASLWSIARSTFVKKWVVLPPGMLFDTFRFNCAADRAHEVFEPLLLTMLAHGWPIDEGVDQDAETLLYRAAASADHTPWAVETVRTLLQHGASTLIICGPNRDMAIHRALQLPLPIALKISKLLLAQNPDIQVRHETQSGDATLSIAMRNIRSRLVEDESLLPDAVALVKLLVSHGASANMLSGRYGEKGAERQILQRDNMMVTPLDSAKALGIPELVSAMQPQQSPRRL